MHWKPQQPLSSQESPAPSRPEPISFSEPWNYELCFPRDPRGPGIARVTLRAVLGTHGLQELVERAELLASELTTNAVCHTVGPASVRLHWQHPALRVSVWDTKPARQPQRLGAYDETPLASPQEEMTGGRGLLLLDVLADRWGVCTLGDGPWGLGGKTVWFELRVGDGMTPTLAA